MKLTREQVRKLREAATELLDGFEENPELSEALLGTDLLLASTTREMDTKDATVTLTIESALVGEDAQLAGEACEEEE